MKKSKVVADIEENGKAEAKAVRNAVPCTVATAQSCPACQFVLARCLSCHDVFTSASNVVVELAV